MNGVTGNMDSRYYFDVLDELLIPDLIYYLGDIWTLIHDVASFHRYNHTTNWL